MELINLVLHLIFLQNFYNYFRSDFLLFYCFTFRLAHVQLALAQRKKDFFYHVQLLLGVFKCVGWLAYSYICSPYWHFRDQLHKAQQALASCAV